MSIADKITSEQSRYEWHFSASLFSGGADQAQELCADLLPEDFVNKGLGKFWNIVRGGADPLSVANDLGITDQLIEKAMNVPDLYRIDEHARQIKRYAYLRRAAQVASDIVRGVSKEDIPAIESIISNANEYKYVNDRTILETDDLSSAFCATVESDRPPAVMTFMPPIDNSLGGFFGSELIVVASRPGVGKTQFCLQIARNIATNGGKALFFSLEMSAVQLWARMACPLTGVQWRDVRAGHLNDAQKADLIGESEKLARRLAGRLIVVDSALDVFSIQAVAMRVKPDIVFIDQLPDVEWHERGAKEIEWYGRACKFFRQHIARRLGIPVVLIHQINRSTEGRPDKRPLMSDLKWSGEIEQRSDVIMLGYREDMYSGRVAGVHRVPIEWKVGKNRQGDSGILMMFEYDLRQQWFT